MDAYMNLPLTRREANALLHLIAAANSEGNMRPEKADVQVGSWLADRILRVMQERAEYEAGVAALNRTARGE